MHDKITYNENVADLSNPKIEKINKKIHDLIILLIKEEENEIQNIIYALNFEYGVLLHTIAKLCEDKKIHSFDEVVKHFTNHLLTKFSEFIEFYDKLTQNKDAK